ncbi:MAG: branched-chain amino acid ABC transporter substrate-binding protein [Acetobacteraceae bacterium]
MGRGAILAAAGLLALGLAGAGPACAADIRVGAQVPTSGSEAPYGIDMLNAIRMAAGEINAKGGVLGEKIRILPGDAACDPQAAVNAASKLVSQNVTGVVGGYCSGATLPTLKVYGDAHVPFVITASNSTELIGANPGNAFMINSTGFDQVKTAVNLFKARGIKTLAIINEGDAYSANLAELTRKAWEKLGNKVVDYEVVSKGQQDFSPVVTRIRQRNPDLVFWTAYYADGALLIKQLRQGGYTKEIALGDGNNSPKLFQIAGAAANGVFCFSNPTADFLPEAKTFIEDYQKQFHQPPGPYSALSYDGMMLLAHAITVAGSTDRTKVIAALKKTDNFPGIAGPISFTPQNTLARSNFVVLLGKGGQWTLYTGPGAPGSK